MDAVLLLLLVARIRGKAVPTDDKSYRGSDRDACRENGGPNRDTTPLPLPSCRGWIDGSFQRRVQRSLFGFRAFWSVSGGEGRGTRPTTPLPPPTPDPSRCPVPSPLYPSRSTFLHLPPPRPCLSVSPGSGQRTRQAGQRT